MFHKCVKIIIIKCYIVNRFYLTGYWRGRPKVHSAMSKGFLTWQTCITLLKFEQIMCLWKSVEIYCQECQRVNVACKTLTSEEGTI